MTDPKFTDIRDYRDVESLNMYRILLEQGKSEQEVLDILQRKSRDNSRTPMQWDDSAHAGFTSGTPWIRVADNYRRINVKQALADPDSIFYHYKRLISLRKQYDIITTGRYELLLEDDPHIFAYMRHGEKEKLLVVNNFYPVKTTFVLPKEAEMDGWKGERLLSNYPDSPDDFRRIDLRPYESVVYLLLRP